MRRLQLWAFTLFMGLFTWHMISWAFWEHWVPPPILDWVSSSQIITSSSHPQVHLAVIKDWEIVGRVIFRQRIVDPILPTIGKFPESFISPIDVFIARETWAEPVIFSTIKAYHEFRTAWFESGSRDFKPEYVAHEHTIPANYFIYKELLSLEKGDMVRLRGKIVDVKVIERNQVRTYATSDSLTDVGYKGSRPGSGACEILFVESVERL